MVKIDAAGLHKNRRRNFNKRVQSEVETSSPNAPLLPPAKEKIKKYTNFIGKQWLFLRFPFIWYQKEIYS